MRHGKKRERAGSRGGGKQRECATVRMKIYKYVRFKRQLGDGELRKERKRWQEKEEKEEGSESRGRRTRFD